MARRLESLQVIVHKARRCFATSHTGERFYYTFKREIKGFKTAEGTLDPHIYVIPEGRPNLVGSEGWYPVRALWFEMPDGEIVK